MLKKFLLLCLWTIWLSSNLWTRNLPLCIHAQEFFCLFFYFCFLLFLEYPLNPKSRSSRMLVIKKSSTKELQISGFPVVGNLHSQPVKNGTGTNVYKGLVPKPATPSTKVSLWCVGMNYLLGGEKKSTFRIRAVSPLRILWLKHTFKYWKYWILEEPCGLEVTRNAFFFFF